MAVEKPPPPVNDQPLLSPKVHQDLADEESGGRHYHGAGLGRFTVWKCPACGRENIGSDITVGCGHCGAGTERPFLKRAVPWQDPQAGEPMAERVKSWIPERRGKVAFKPTLTRPAPTAVRPNARSPMMTADLIDYARIDAIVGDRLIEALITFRKLLAVSQLELLLDDERWRRAVAEGVMIVKASLEEGRGTPDDFPAPHELEAIANALMDVELEPQAAAPPPPFYGEGEEPSS